MQKAVMTTQSPALEQTINNLREIVTRIPAAITGHVGARCYYVTCDWCQRLGSCYERDAAGVEHHPGVVDSADPTKVAITGHVEGCLWQAAQLALQQSANP